MNFKKTLAAFLAGSMMTGLAVLGTTAKEPLPFTDVGNAWYTSAVETVYSEGVMNGKSDTAFDPNANITRAEVVTAFSRIACININGYEESLPFTDTVAGQWYSNSVGWAAENNIVKGRGDNTFSPSDKITRAELASILVNFISYMELDLPTNAKIDKFTDASSFANWMKPAIEEVRRTGLMQGVDGKFNPLGNATRAEIAQVVKNILPFTGRVTVVENGVSDYVIVASAEAADAAERLQYQIEFTTGAKLKITDRSASAKAIVLGGTSMDTEGLGKDGFKIDFDGTKVLIDGETADGIYRGAVRFALSAVSADDARFTLKTAESAVYELPVKSLKINGNNISAYKIFYSANASEKTTTGVNDLVKYIELACGVRLGTSTASPSGKAIIVEEKTVDVAGQIGNADNFRVKSEGDNIRITGSAERGAMYGCYDFLEECVGCRFLYVDADYVIPADEIDIKAVDYSETPGFIYRTMYMDPTIENEDVINKYRLVSPVFTGTSAHSFDSLDGDYSSQYENQPCLTSEDVYQTMLGNVMKLLEANPEAKYISISQNDNFNYCTCASCQVSDEKYGGAEGGGPAGTLIAFVNRMTEEINKTYPDVIVHTFAYLHTKTAPKNITVNKNVLVQLCTDYCCRTHRYYDGCFINSTFTAALEEWGALTEQLFIWDYGNWECNVTPDITYDVLGHNFNSFAKFGTVMCFFQGATNSEVRGHFEALRAYMISKLCWNPNMGEDEFNRLVTEFLEGFYGKAAAPYVQKAIDCINDSKASCFVESDEKEYAMSLRNDTPIASAYMDEGELYTESSTHFGHVDCSQIQFERLYLDFDFSVSINSSTPENRQRVIDASFALQEKFQKYQIPISIYGVPNITEFTRPPYEWREILDEMIYGSEGD